MSTKELKSDSQLEKVLASGGFGVTAELGPPKSADAAEVRENAEHLQGAADAVNITDNQTAIVRMSSFAAAVLAKEKGLDPVMQITCRDRNRLAMQADILGAAALGIKNLLCLSGDHQKFGNHPQAKSVFDLDSVQMIAMVKQMRDDKQFLCGDAIKEHEPRIFIGAVENPFADPFEFRVMRLAKKIEAGADLIGLADTVGVAHYGDRGVFHYVLDELVAASGYDKVDVFIHVEHVSDVGAGFKQSEPAVGQASFYRSVTDDICNYPVGSFCFAAAF